MFPGRLIVVDKSHVLRKLNEGMERVRRQIRKSADDKTKFKLKDERSLLLKRKCHLKEEESVKVQRWFAMFPKLGIAYEAKEHFYNIYSQPTRAAAECSAKKWVSNLDPEIEKPFRVLRVALNDWHEEIFNYFDYQVDNTYTESIDNINRFISRMGRGYSFGALRARLLFEDQIIKGEKSDGDKSEETVVNYGADLLTLARLLEEGHFS
jgi:transposase